MKSELCTLYITTMYDQLKSHLKNFTVKELKKEVLNVKKDFQVSKLKRAEVENVILINHQHFKHLLEKKKAKKTKPTLKKIKQSFILEPGGISSL